MAKEGGGGAGGAPHTHKRRDAGEAGRFVAVADVKGGSASSIHLAWSTAASKAFQAQIRAKSLEASIGQRLGGRKVLGRSVSSEADLVKIVEAGLPVRVMDKLKQGGRFTDKELRNVIPPRTLRHRRDKRERLTAEESDRAVRLLRVQALADAAFGDAEKADKWLRRASAVFDGKTAIETANTEAGARTVETALAKIAWGAAS